MKLTELINKLEEELLEDGDPEVSAEITFYGQDTVDGVEIAHYD